MQKKVCRLQHCSLVLFPALSQLSSGPVLPDLWRGHVQHRQLTLQVLQSNSERTCGRWGEREVKRDREREVLGGGGREKSRAYPNLPSSLLQSRVELYILRHNCRCAKSWRVSHQGVLPTPTLTFFVLPLQVVIVCGDGPQLVYGRQHLTPAI